MSFLWIVLLMQILLVYGELKIYMIWFVPNLGLFFVITLANCPLQWLSNLQSDIALSTLHAEYVALSQSLRELLPLKDLVKEVTSVLNLSDNFSTITKSTVFEDNQRAITIATFPCLTPTSKRIAVKYH